MATLFKSMAKAKSTPNVDTNSVSSQAASNEPKAPSRPSSVRHVHLKTNRSLTAPATMISALLCGLGLILAQNFMYVALNGREVSTVSVSQSWISTISTGLAFAIKVALVIAVGAAYVQHQWVRLQQRSFKVAEIDALTAADSNLLYLFNSTVWLRYPVLAIMVLLTWTIPISSTVTPGSLNIAPVQKFANHNTQVPQPQYNFTNYGEEGAGGAYGQLSESNDLTRLMAYTASSGMPVNLVPPFPNATYDLEFYGPALRCSSANSTVVNNASIYYSEGNTGDQVTFAAWVGGEPNASYALPQAGYPTLDLSSTDTCRIFVMTSTGTWNETANVTGNPQFNNNYTTAPTLVNVTECDLWNATWNVHFNFQYPNQTRTVDIKNFTNPVAFMMNFVQDFDNGQSYTYANPANETNVQSYAAMMSAFGALLVGYAETSHYGSISELQTRHALVDIDWMQASAEAVERGLESLFQNFTLSLLSDSGLTKNSSVAEHIPVNVETWPILYVYHPLRLWLANGLALLATVICVCIGMHAFVHNDASYSNTFSTYVRAAHDTGLDMYINRADTGIWPPPKSFKQAQVSFGSKVSRTNTVRTNAMDDEPRSPEDRLLERSASGQEIR